MSILFVFGHIHTQCFPLSGSGFCSVGEAGAAQRFSYGWKM
jgi:hypothetical protein